MTRAVEEHRRLPGKATENGIELFSETDELDLIRGWLPGAPGTVKVVRVSHRLRDGEDSFTVSCVFEDAKDPKTVTEVERALQLWAKRSSALELPHTVWVGFREIHLLWYPLGLEPKTRDELTASERAEEDFHHQTDQARCIWRILQGDKATDLQMIFGSFDESFANIAQLAPFESSTGVVLSQDALFDSIYEYPDIWFYVLAKAAQAGIRCPLLTDFKEACRQAREGGKIPDLSQLSQLWDLLWEENDCCYPQFSTVDHERASQMYGLAVQLLEDLLEPRLPEVNELIRLTEAHEAESED